ncbi:MAG: hypothetical protein HYW06_09100 [Gemmatimonadetes bacterium]|nr:hypothetical protein [Gemmatimonadota bacterium]MBI2537096.1 hypothetical protein [Gemmatimonadota bacterium]
MGKINWGRVIAGGLLAGVVLNVFDFVVNGWLLSDQWTAAMTALGKGQMGGSMIIWFMVVDFLLGIAAVWLYAAIRPRFGAGPKTAAWAGLFVWFLLGFLHAMFEVPMGLFPANLYWISTAAALVFVPLAVVVGAWLYQEEAA